MLSTLKTILLATYFGVSTALFTTAIVLAILHYYGRIPHTYINQYNINPTINYIILQQPPPARIHALVHNHGLLEIHELSSVSSQ